MKESASSLLQMGLTRASSPWALSKPQRMEKFIWGGRKGEWVLSFHPGIQVLKVEIRHREELIKGEEGRKKVEQGR